jgi:hypothetical protein
MKTHRLIQRGNDAHNAGYGYSALRYYRRALESMELFEVASFEYRGNVHYVSYLRSMISQLTEIWGSE